MADDEKRDKLIERFSGLADKLGLKGRDRQAYIDDHMKVSGYKAVRSYTPADEDDNKGRRWGGSKKSDDDDDDDF